MTATRTETDSLGSIEIEADRWWGPQTERARRLFQIGVEHFPPGLIRAVGLQKQAAAEANRDLGELPAELADPIVAAAREIAAGQLDAEFPLPVWQTGSGTQTNMNVNEVIANRANQLLGGLDQFIAVTRLFADQPQQQRAQIAGAEESATAASTKPIASAAPCAFRKSFRESVAAPAAAASASPGKPEIGIGLLPAAGTWPPPAMFPIARPASPIPAVAAMFRCVMHFHFRSFLRCECTEF